ncbi:hypothetical protein [Paludibacterium yongneupense]|uniref:hypothetical protein n=1 Tax=Paludibacterium yongneupense TaxID=400061 RepID=UPI0003FD00E6|nr:hypothetical protein [Paludibacterium yongneupense]
MKQAGHPFNFDDIASIESALFLENDIIAKPGKNRYSLHVNKLAGQANAIQACSPPRILLISFFMSTNEEHTKIRIRLVDEAIDLGEREHHYLLATLARKRLADFSAGIDSTAQGWLERPELATMLGIDVQHANIHIFRARQQIAKLAPSHGELNHIIECRRGGIRLAAVPFEIYRGARIEGSYAP